MFLLEFLAPSFIVPPLVVSIWIRHKIIRQEKKVTVESGAQVIMVMK